MSRDGLGRRRVDWSEVERHLLAVLDRSSAARRKYLDRVLGADPVLRGEVESLLSLEPKVETFLERPVEDDALGEPPLPRRIGPWRVERELGRGGVSRVYLARGVAPGLPAPRVALKVLRREADHPEIRWQFRSEPRLLERCDQAGVVRLLGTGELEDGRPYSVLEYVDGVPIDAYCDTRRESVERRIDRFLELCDAVAHVHRKGVVHRDLKPGNVLVTREGRPRLIDFGIAKVVDDGREGTQPLVPLLTPGYASPQQVRGAPVSVADDLYSLGALLFRLLVGEVPEGTVPASVAVGRGPRARRVARARRTSAAGLRRVLRDGLDQILHRTLADDPARRPPSVEALAADLRRWRRGRAVEAPARSRLRRPMRGSRAALWLVATALGVSVVVAAAVSRPHHRTSSRLRRCTRNSDPPPGSGAPRARRDPRSPTRFAAGAPEGSRGPG